MKEIKYRVWDETNKIWLDSSLFNIRLDDGLLQRNGSAGTIGGIKIVEYTGLKDKNGKEIYEGDIIQWWNGVNEPRVVEATNAGWNPFIDDCTTDHPYHYKVIGNIYENGDLLK